MRIDKALANGNANGKAKNAASSAHDGPWFDGTVEQGFAAAKRDGKPILLYWGAVWCPPCNQLKSQVFSQPRFRELVKPLIAIHIDGDSEDAQSWGERLKIGGYPTVLVLDRSGREILRLDTSVDMDGFEIALMTALTAGGTINQAIHQGLAGHASDAEWRMLAYYSWEEAPDLGFDKAALLEARARLAALAPVRLKTAKALLVAAFLDGVANAGNDPALKAKAEALRPEASLQLDRLLGDHAAERAARALLVYEPAEVISYLYPKAQAEQQERQAMAKRWAAAAAQLAADRNLSVDTRLMATSVPLQLLKLQNPQDKPTPVPPAMRVAVQKAVAQADHDAQSVYERHAVISDAADLLVQAGDLAGARQLLDKELKTTDTPWYYQADYAALEEQAGHTEAALAWSKAARESAKGPATRIQWISNDLLRTARLAAPNQDERLAALVKLYYDTALALPDGFKGRNAARARRVAAQLKPWLAKPDFRRLVDDYAKRCQTGQGVAPGCAAHFAALQGEMPATAKPHSGA